MFVFCLPNSNILLLDYPVSSDFDILLTDIHEKEIVEKICPLFGITNLQKSTCNDYKKIKGIVWGPLSRQVAPMVLEYKGEKKDTVFIVDTGSPQTYLAQSSFNAFGLDLITRGKRFMKIHGKELLVDQSHSHFADVNVLGTDFFTGREVVLVVDYRQGKYSFTMELHR